MENTVFRGDTNEATNENSLKLLVVSAGPLSDLRNAILEMSKAWEDWHGTKPSVEVNRINNGGTPFFQVVLEDTLVKLM